MEENYICKIANRDELLKRWDYLIEIHPGNNKWVEFKENALKHFDEKSTISYLGFLNDKSICEITAYIKDSAFIGDISDSSGLLNDSMAYLAAFRTNKEFEGKGYFSKLYNFVENDLKEKGYTELSLGVGPEAVRNMEIYFHLGYRDYIKTLIEYEQSQEAPLKKEEDVILFYKKKIK
ncbi:MAG: GNAT family N-acetyltransferase [Clostridia bacterium]|nr:GNAT family N-acetyltransferase [Clostridia bacterium]